MKYPLGSRERDGSRASEEASALNHSQQEERKTQRSGLCEGVEGDLYGIDSCRYVLLVNQAVSLVQKGAGPNLEAWLSRRVLATSGSLARLVCCTVHPCPPFGRTWELLPIYVAVEHGQSHSEAGRKGHSLSGTTLAFQYRHRLSTKGKVVWQSIKRNM